MYVTVIAYALVILLILWGGRFAGFGDRFHDDFMSISSTRALRGLAAVCIILHHTSQEAAFQDAKVIQAFLNMGPVLVTVFFFCSGFGLIKNLNSKPGYLDGFLYNRLLLRLAVPFYVNVILYGIFHLIYGTEFEPLQWVTNLLGLTMMNKYAWFPVVLMILYIAFYYIFKKVKDRRMAFFLMFLVIFFQGVFFCVWGHFAWWAGPKNWWLKPNGFLVAKWWMQEFTTWFFGQWWVNATIGFIPGMLFAQHEESITNWFKKHYWLKLAGVLVLAVLFHAMSSFVQFKFGYYTEYSGRGPGIGDKFITYLSQLPQIGMIIIFVILVTMKYKADNPVLEFFGKYSLHTYLMNLIPLMVFRPMIQHGKAFPVPIVKPGNYNLAIYALLVIALTVILALIEYRITDLVTGLLRSARSKKVKED